jgi:hypothetical protein
VYAPAFGTTLRPGPKRFVAAAGVVEHARVYSTDRYVARGGYSLFPGIAQAALNIIYVPLIYHQTVNKPVGITF